MSESNASKAVPLVEVGWIKRTGREAIRGVMAGEEVIAPTLLIVLRLGADVEYLPPQRNIRGRRLVPSVEGLRV